MAENAETFRVLDWLYSAEASSNRKPPQPLTRNHNPRVGGSSPSSGISSGRVRRLDHVALTGFEDALVGTPPGVSSLGTR